MSTIDRILFPKIIYTTGYLSGPIRYESDPRFIPSSVITEVETPNHVERDLASFLKVNAADPTTQTISIPLRSQMWDRTKYETVMGSTRKNFQFFV